MIGAATSKALDLTLLNKGDMVYGTSTIKVEIGLKIGSKIEYIPMGIYNIDDIEKTDYTIKITAYDNMIKFERNFTTNLGDTLTLQQIVNELVRITGVQFTGTLPAYSVKKLEGFSCREVLGYVASICGGNAVITRDGKFTIVTPKDVNYAIGTANYFDYKREETKYKIGKVSCQVGEKVLSKGSLGADSMELEFENPWVTTAILNNIYTKLNGFEYLGYSMKWQGDLSLDVGDIVTITDKKGVVRKHPILSQKFTYTGGLTSEIGAKGETKNKNSFSSSGSAAKKVERVVMELALINKALIDVAYIGDLTAGNIKFDTASGGTLDLQTLLAKFVSGENGQFLNLTTDNVTISNAVIKDIIAKNMSVENLKAGNIDSNRFNIVGPNGNLVIKDNTIQIKDSARVRVQIGKDARGDYSMYVWDKQGNLMFDALGLKSSAIKDKIIRDDMISDNADINASKININSLITQINKDNTQTLKASKIAFDSTGQSLEVSFNSLKTNVDSKENRNLALETATSCEADSSLLNGGVNKTRLLYKTYTNRLKVGDKVTISFDFEYTNLKIADGKTINDVRLFVQGSGNVTEWGSGGFPSYSFREKITYGSTEKKKVHITYSATIYDNQMKNQYWMPNIRADYIIGGTYKVTNFKFEVGNETGWTPAPEDINKIGEKIESNTTSIKAVQGNIGTLIKDTTIEKDGKEVKLKDAYSSLNQTVDSIKSTVTSQETITNQKGKNIRCNDFGIKINHSAFGTVGNGSLYLHGFDKYNNPTDTNGAIYWNGTKISVSKGMISPGSNFGIGNDVYIFINKTNSSVVMGGYYDASAKVWKYKHLIGGTASGTFTPNVDHIALGMFNMKEAKTFNYAFLFDNPQSLKNLTVGVADLITRVNTAESKLTATSLTTTISTAINNGTNSITTTQFVMDKNGLTIKNGAIKIQNKAGTNVFASDTNGNLTITGTFINKNSNGVKAIEINNTNIYFYDWERNGRELGVIYSSYLTNYPNCRGFSIAHNSQGYLTFGYRKPDSNFGTYIILDKYSKNPNYAAPIRFLESAVFSQAVNMQNRVYVPNTIVFDDVYRSTSAKMFKAPTANRLVLEVSVNAVGDGLRIQSNTGSLLAQIRAGEHYPIHLNNNTYISGDLAASGSKNSLQATKSYGERLINAYETAEYYFGDIGSGVIKDGECIVWIDDIFKECINTDIEYHVFTQIYNGSITKIERHKDYFIVYGENETEFSWELKAKRVGYENVRLDAPEIGTIEYIPVFTEEDLEVKTVEDTLLDVLTFKLEDILMEG